MRGVLGGAADVFATARAERRSALTESEALELVRGLGIGVPEHAPVRGAAAAHSLDLRMFPGDRVVVKVVSPEILHKTDAGGVAVVAKDREAIAAAIDAMAGRLYDTIQEGTTFLAMSDHGFGRLRRDVYINRWLEEQGYLAFASGKKESVADIDPQRTRAFCMDPGRVYLNVKTRSTRAGSRSGSNQRRILRARMAGPRRLSGITRRSPLVLAC